MAWINVGGNNVTSFAEYDDVVNMDQRVFEANEGLTDTVVEDLLIKSTTRILQQIRNTSWWKAYYLRMASPAQQQEMQTLSTNRAPLPDPNKIKDRISDFTDLCVYYALYEYLYPRIADFSTQDAAEVVKIGVYREKYQALFRELVEDGAWYDWDASGSVGNLERMPTKTNLVRIR